MIYTTRRFSQTEDQISEAKDKSKLGAGMITAGIGAYIGGGALANNGVKKYLGSAEGSGFKTALDQAKATKTTLGKDQLAEFGKGLSNAAKGVGSSTAVSGARRFMAGGAIRTAGLGLGALGLAKVAYDNLKSKD